MGGVTVKIEPVGGAPRGDYVQAGRYFAKEHVDVRRDWFGFARPFKSIAAGRASHSYSNSTHQLFLLYCHRLPILGRVLDG